MNDSNDQCPICGEGKLQPRVGENSVDYQGQTTKLAFHFSVCDACGSEQADAAQTRTNKRLMVAFKKRVDGLLTGVSGCEMTLGEEGGFKRKAPFAQLLREHAANSRSS